MLASLASLASFSMATGCAAPQSGVLRVAGRPDEALVTVDDQYVGKLGRLKRFGVKVPAGEHRLTIEANGHFPHDQLVTVPGRGETKVDIVLEPVPE